MLEEIENIKTIEVEESSNEFEILRKKAEMRLKQGIPEAIDELETLLKNSVILEQFVEDDFNETNPSTSKKNPNVKTPANTHKKPPAAEHPHHHKKIKKAPDVHLIVPISSRTHDGQTVAVPCNKELLSIIVNVKEVLQRLGKDCELLREWILKLIPVGTNRKDYISIIQRQAVRKINDVKSKGWKVFEELEKYLQSRKKMIVQLLKYPRIEEFHGAILELDRNENSCMHFTVKEVQNLYRLLEEVTRNSIQRLKSIGNLSDTEIVYGTAADDEELQL